MEYLEDNLEEWLGGELEAYGDDDYLIFDCPGQIELYSHLSVFRTFVEYLKRDGWQICVVRRVAAAQLAHACAEAPLGREGGKVCSCRLQPPTRHQSPPPPPPPALQVYCLDCQFTSEMPKFVAGTLSALSAMVQLELPHVNVLTKVDMCKDKVGRGGGLVVWVGGWVGWVGLVVGEWRRAGMPAPGGQALALVCPLPVFAPWFLLPACPQSLSFVFVVPLPPGHRRRWTRFASPTRLKCGTSWTGRRGPPSAA